LAQLSETAAATSTSGTAGAGLTMAARLARRELRAGLKGFRIFLACLALGVAAIAGVGSLSEAMLAGLEANGRALLGGDVELRLIHRRATTEEQAWLESHSAGVSRTAELRGMARSLSDATRRRLVEVKAVDSAYPLVGRFVSEPAMPVAEALAGRDGRWGALVDPGLLARLDLAVGDRLKLGALDYEIRGTVDYEPDRAARAVTLGPRMLVHLDSLAETGLEQPGSLIYHHYRLRLPPGQSAGDWVASLNAAHPEAGWRVRDVKGAAPGMVRLVTQVTLFMTLVGLTALLVGGVGIANAVKSFLDEKRATIATLKCLGAPARLIFQTYLLQVLGLASLGIVLGLALGAGLPWVIGPALSERLNFALGGTLFVRPLAMATLFGVLITLVFSLWPLARAQQIPAASLFRDLVQRARSLPPPWAIAASALAGAALIAAAILGTSDSAFAVTFVGAAIAVLGAFRLAALGLTWLASALPRQRHPALRLALANLHRPGAPTAGVVTSLGLGVTVLVAIALIEGNLSRQVLSEMPAEAPGFYFIDIQPHQVEAFEAAVREVPGVSGLERVPMLRGRISGVNGKRPEEMAIPGDVAWVFRGERGLTWAVAPPEGTTITEGEWWPADYQGPPLVSLDAAVGRALDLHPGDRLTINVLGRDFEVTIASLRAIRWADLKINFVMIFSPGLLDQAPQMNIATVRIDPEREDELERRVTDGFPNVSSIRVKEALASFAEMLASIATAVTATAGVTLLAGTLVLAGAVAAGHRRRIYDAVVLKVLGATRRDVARAFLLEYGIIGVITAAISAVFGSIAAQWILISVMGMDFILLPLRVVLTAALATLVTLAFGFLGTWRALAQRAAPLLRNE
jgi:putative ABC transport system permease protein